MAHKQHIYFDDTTHKMCRELAEASGMSISGWVKHVVRKLHAKQFNPQTTHHKTIDNTQTTHGLSATMQDVMNLDWN